MFIDKQPHKTIIYGGLMDAFTNVVIIDVKNRTITFGKDKKTISLQDVIIKTYIRGYRGALWPKITFSIQKDKKMIPLLVKKGYFKSLKLVRYFYSLHQQNILALDATGRFILEHPVKPRQVFWNFIASPLSGALLWYGSMYVMGVNFPFIMKLAKNLPLLGRVVIALVVILWPLFVYFGYRFLIRRFIMPQPLWVIFGSLVKSLGRNQKISGKLESRNFLFLKEKIKTMSPQEQLELLDYLVDIPEPLPVIRKEDLLLWNYKALQEVSRKIFMLGEDTLSLTWDEIDDLKEILGGPHVGPIDRK